jgi:hypothetical protein
MHKTQREVYLDNSRIRALCCGRRWGKSRLQILEIFLRCVQFPRTVSATPEVILAAAPTLIQAKKVLWKPLVTLFENFPDVKINHTEHRIQIPGKPDVYVMGLENYDGARGLRVYSAHIDEAQDIRPGVLDSVVVPAMGDTPGSKMLLTFTPKGKTNWLYPWCQNPDVKFFNFPTESNPFIPREEIQRMERLLPPRLFRQEYFATWENFEGQVFSSFEEAKNCYNWRKVSGATLADWLNATGMQVGLTYMGVDWGDVNPAYIVVVSSGTEFFVTEWVKLGDGKNAVPSQQFYEVLASACRRWNVYRTFCDPSRPAAIQDLRRLGQLKNIPGLLRTIEAKNSIAPGNSLLDSLFHQARLSVPPGVPVEELQSYVRAPLGNLTFGDKIAPGQNDHCIDALRYAMYTLDVRNNGVVGQPGNSQGLGD